MFRKTNTRPLELLAFLLVIGLLVAVTFSPASSRPWKPTPSKLALDYATINDYRLNSNLIILMWFAAPMIQPEQPNAAQVRALLDKYIFLAVVDGHLDRTTGTFSFDDITNLEAKDANGKSLALVERNNMPPTAIGAVTTIEKLFQQALGATGKGMKMFVFEAGGVSACKKGQLAVPFAGDTYTWDTPFPGCS